MNEKEVKLREAADKFLSNCELNHIHGLGSKAWDEFISTLTMFAKSEAARQYHSPSKQEGTEAVCYCGVPNINHGTCCGWINASISINAGGVITTVEHPYFGRTYSEYISSINEISNTKTQNP